MAQSCLAAAEKKGLKTAASVVFLDESGFQLQPVNRRTWAPRGQTPVQRASARHDRLSVIGALSLAPRQRRVGLYFEIQSGNVRADDVVRFVRGLRRRLRRRIILVLDRWPVHFAAVRRLREAGCDWLEVEWLPPYAPELNPVEQMWSHAKYSDLANFVPDDAAELEDAVIESLCEQYQEHDLKRAFFRAAGLN